MSSAVLMGDGSMLEAEQIMPHAQLRELAPGAMQPEGWLRGMLEKQAAQLGSKLPQVSWPFTGAYWAGEEKDESIKPGQSWFPWEQKGYWIDGAVRLALVLGDDQLIEQVWASISYTLTHADTDGYLGPQLFKYPKGDDDHHWPQAVFSQLDGLRKQLPLPRSRARVVEEEKDCIVTPALLCLSIRGRQQRVYLIFLQIRNSLEVDQE
jgi:hypothetical protein